jgi:PIN domain nuclease of toxin-antitoxin system
MTSIYRDAAKAAMRDTPLLLWAAVESKRLPANARSLMADPANELLFSVASLWEVAIKHGLGRPSFRVEPGILRRALLDNAYVELPILSQHAVAVANLPPIHHDPFDRMLVAQANVEGAVLLTADANVARYPGSVRRV